MSIVFVKKVSKKFKIIQLRWFCVNRVPLTLSIHPDKPQPTISLVITAKSGQEVTKRSSEGTAIFCRPKESQK